MSEDEAGPAGETEICAPGGGAVAGPPSSALDSAGFSVQLRALDISEAMGRGQGGEAPVPGLYTPTKLISPRPPPCPVASIPLRKAYSLSKAGDRSAPHFVFCFQTVQSGAPHRLAP